MTGIDFSVVQIGRVGTWNRTVYNLRLWDDIPVHWQW